MTEAQNTKRYASPIRYTGNLFWLIFFLIVFLPIGLVSLLRNGQIVTSHTQYTVDYHGDWFWLYFWAIFCFPISGLLLLIKGVDLVETQL